MLLRLVGCDFLALMKKELAPAGIDDLQRVPGPQDNG
ncbi:hypothetical protein OZ10_16665 [Xanthomonas cannabis pv. cannabis]|nr:hypothetical protein OZ10_16665 [Xanthomonas cannabis pv. cannabis]